MVINKDKFKLGDNSYIKKIYPKKMVVIGNTKSSGMKHFNTWLNKINGKYKKTAAFTITLSGKIYQHYNPKYYSKYVDFGSIDKNIIPITLENEGWFIKDFKTEEYINWLGEKYTRCDKLFEKSWRGKLKWAPYSNKQIDSLVYLTEKMIKDFNIVRFVNSNNVKNNDITKKKGIYYRSNFLKSSLDVSPAFNIKEFKNKIEDNEK